MRNHNELLRCLGTLASMHPDDAVTFLLRSLEGAKEAAARCGALDALRHLVPRLAAGLRGREQAVLSGVSLLLVDGEWRVRLALVELISGLGANGCAAAAAPPTQLRHTIRAVSHQRQ